MAENSINIKVAKGYNKTISAEQMCRFGYSKAIK
jgi:hypothetical protein